jgi:hypothetical protein
MMKRIKIITDVVELENTVNRADIEILQIDIKACEQSQFAQDYFVAVIYYQEQSAPIPQADDYRTKYEALRSQVGEVADRVYNCIYERSLFPLHDIADKLDKLAKEE